MPRQPLNTISPAPKQMWEHVKTQIVLLIVDVDAEMQLAECAVMASNKLTKARVLVPLCKFMNWGNRGMGHIGNRKGKLPKTVGHDDCGTFNTRQKMLGAV